MKLKSLFLLLAIAFISSSAMAQIPPPTPQYVVPFQINGKNYAVIKYYSTWIEAAFKADSMGGYLVEINNQLEQDSVYNAILNKAGISTTYTTVADGGGIAYVWIGATDKYAEGTWMWDGDDNNVGTHFWSGQGSAGLGGGSAVSGAYNNWGGKASGTINEPDDYMSNQDAGAIGLNGWPGGSGALGIAGEWNDIAITNSLFFVVEFDITGIQQNEESGFNIITMPDALQITSKEELRLLEIYTIDGKLLKKAQNIRDSYTFYGLPKNIALFIRGISTSGNTHINKVILR